MIFINDLFSVSYKENAIFIEFFSAKICVYQIKAVILHRISITTQCLTMKNSMVMSAEELKKLEDEVRSRLADALSTEMSAEDFVIKMVASFHTTKGAALYRISDYMSARGY